MQEVLIFIGGFALGALVLIIYFSKNKSGAIPEASYNELKSQLESKEKTMTEQSSRLEALIRSESTLKQQLADLQNSYDLRLKDFEELQVKFKSEFKNLAEEILEEKSKKFKEENRSNLDIILTPFKEQLKNFEKKVDETHKEGIRERSGLTEQIKLLAETNLQMQEDAKNLTQAIKGDSKVQGDWGEDLLQRILEKAGLQKGIHFDTQSSFRNEDGGQSRPDYIIMLPDDRQLIVDSKVSLTHYAKYHEEENGEKKEKALKQHLLSMWNHVKSLRKANYEGISEIKSPDYVLMYVPIESAFNAVMKEKPSFFLEALDQNVVVVTGSTLLATMQTVSYIWKQDNLNKRTLDIAKLGGSLHDKIHSFVENYSKLGNQLETVQKTYQTAEKQLSSGNGNMVRIASRLKEMGAKVSPGKEFPKNLIENAEDV